MKIKKEMLNKCRIYLGVNSNIIQRVISYDSIGGRLMLINDDKILSITYKDIVLRDRSIKDIDDHIKWYTLETEWQNWDAPWEKGYPIDIEIMRYDMMEDLEKPLPRPRKRSEIYYKDGKHIGWLSSYYIDGKDNMLAVGIDIPNQNYRGNRLGEYALACFISYLLKEDLSKDIYTQTWSGNERMVNLALKLGFKEFHRDKNFRIINKKYYDGLTFKLDKDMFFNK